MVMTRGEFTRDTHIADTRLVSTVLHATAVGARRATTTYPTSDATAVIKTVESKEHAVMGERQR